MRYLLALICCVLLPEAAKAATTTAKVACRASASQSARVIEQVPAGMRVAVLERRTSWSKIDRRRDCWVSDQYLRDDQAATSTYYPTPRYHGGSSTRAETRRANRRSLAAVRRSFSGAKRSRRSSPSYFGGGSCPCSGGNVCIGPRGGRYCITSGGNKRYGV